MDKVGLLRRRAIPSSICAMAKHHRPGLLSGDTVYLYVHAMTNLSLTADGFLPSLADDQGNSFVIRIVGPPGVSSRRIEPQRSQGYIPWQLHASWVSSVSGIYKIYVEYGGVQIKGNSTNLVSPLQGSPWTVLVRSAPIEVNYTRIVGTGISFAQVEKLATFEIQTRDIFNNPIRKPSYDKFRGDDKVNVSILSTYGSPMFPRIVSLRDGCYRVEYSVSAGGDYRIFVMINGILLQRAPFILRVQEFAVDRSNTQMYIKFAQKAGQLCEYSIASSQSFNPPCNILVVGELIEFEIDIKDYSNQSVLLSQEIQKYPSLEVLGSSFSKQISFYIEQDSKRRKMSASFLVTKSGAYSVHQENRL
ncbi:hypothetical protein GUITHDRAFT_141225 [Guillardia theta CCMP2712]|uniref:Uncharacterized protein n=1 Tax=Guillardia theta (strain CCMP2712) TaxID=905079 RepID=L1J217_GUITC|nr:hypothetical protein GUITHDRAFT_141225 [Guillardia theta CCMP2712]EKX42566.1 hypothetical protein GUITHDRAFT_141225 [Guillardia theta CCMP2712]|eukprot:XP_005829546.1 hypothetical protein GUITHDRAFT_141225 [Guillardia theta CCMP2712]